MKFSSSIRRWAPMLVSSCAGLALYSCAATSSGPADSPSEIEQLRGQVKTLQEENKLLSLKLQDEIERGTIQVFLVRQEIAAAKRQTAAVRAQCGSACAEPPR